MIPLITITKQGSLSIIETILKTEGCTLKKKKEKKENWERKEFERTTTVIVARVQN